MRRTNSRAAWVSLMAMLLLFALLPACALAIDPYVVPADGCHLKVRFTTNPDEESDDFEVIRAPLFVRVYAVAYVDEFGDYKDSQGQVKWTEKFKAYDGDIDADNAQEWSATARSLAAYVQENGIKDDHHREAEEGIGNVSMTVPPAMYLVTVDKYATDAWSCEMAPQLVCVPSHPVGADGEMDKEEWIYNVVIFGKLDVYDKQIDLTVYKEWNDPGWSSSTRPEYIEITLLADGEPYGDPIYLPRLDDDDNECWNYTWYDLDPTVEWKVEETLIPEYTTQYDPPYGRIRKVTPTEYEVTIINYRPGKSDSSLPQTGLNWTPVVMLAVAGMVLCCLGWISRRADEESDEA